MTVTSLTTVSTEAFFTLVQTVTIAQSTQTVTTTRPLPSLCRALPFLCRTVTKTVTATTIVPAERDDLTATVTRRW